MAEENDQSHDAKESEAAAPPTTPRGPYDHCLTYRRQVVEFNGPEGAVREETVIFDYFSCEEAIRRLNEYLDQELEPAEREVVLKHLQVCKPCLERFDFERNLLTALREKICRIAAPGHLRSKISHLIKHVTFLLMTHP